MALDAAFMAFGMIGAGLLAYLGHFRSRRARRLPSELQAARLVYAERLFRAIGPVSITARVDLVYRNVLGELVLVELKSRQASRAYLSDVIELSAQRIALMEQMKEPVAQHAYVYTEGTNGRKAAWHRVDLMRPRHLAALALRRESLLAGEANAHGTSAPEICRKCAFRRECRLSRNIPAPSALEDRSTAGILFGRQV